MNKDKKVKKPEKISKEVKIQNKKTIKRILSYLGKYKLTLACAFTAMIISVCTNIFGTFLISVLIDGYIIPLSQGDTSVTLEQFGIAVGFMASMLVFGALLSFLYNRIIVKVTTQVLANIRDEMFTKMQKLPIKYFDTHNHGDVMSLYTNDTDALREMLSNGVPNMIVSLCSIVGMFIMMLVLSPILTLFIVVMLFVMMIIMKYLAGKSGKYYAKQQNNIASLNGFVEEHIDGMKVVKVFSHEKHDKKIFLKKTKKLQQASFLANGYSNSFMPIMNNLSYFSYGMTAIIGSIMAINGFAGMAWGKLISFLQFSRQFNNPVAQIAQIVNTIFMAVAGGNRIFEFLDLTPECDEGYVTIVDVEIEDNGNIKESDTYTGNWAWRHYHKDTDSVTYVRWNGEVEFDDVSFGYNEDRMVLDDINIVAKPGQKIALVGSTGAGKTTITNLLNRFYDINEGKIRLDGINIQKIKKDDLRKSIAVVLQDTHLFTGSVSDNIRFGKLDATDEEVLYAAKLANADYFISHLPEGYDTMISGDGSNLSQGQRQLLAIARAAIANPPVLILDEATSSIDTRTEKLIEQGMDKLMQGRTVFVIAHRLSTVRNSDIIMVLESGKVIEQGNHDELLSIKGKYYQLYTGAFELD